jgi:hypothetical protein
MHCSEGKTIVYRNDPVKEKIMCWAWNTTVASTFHQLHSSSLCQATALFPCKANKYDFWHKNEMPQVMSLPDIIPLVCHGNFSVIKKWNVKFIMRACWLISIWLCLIFYFILKLFMLSVIRNFIITKVHLFVCLVILCHNAKPSWDYMKFCMSLQNA